MRISTAQHCRDKAKRPQKGKTISETRLHIKISRHAQLNLECESREFRRPFRLKCDAFQMRVFIVTEGSVPLWDVSRKVRASELSEASAFALQATAAHAL